MKEQTKLKKGRPFLQWSSTQRVQLQMGDIYYHLKRARLLV